MVSLKKEEKKAHLRGMALLGAGGIGVIGGIVTGHPEISTGALGASVLGWSYYHATEQDIAAERREREKLKKVI